MYDAMPYMFACDTISYTILNSRRIGNIFVNIFRALFLVR